MIRLVKYYGGSKLVIGSYSFALSIINRMADYTIHNPKKFLELRVRKDNTFIKIYHIPFPLWTHKEAGVYSIEIFNTIRLIFRWYPLPHKANKVMHYSVCFAWNKIRLLSLGIEVCTSLKPRE